MKAHIVTWAFSVLSACIIGAAWIYTHPTTQKIAVVDLKSVFSEEIAKLDREVTPNMTAEKKQELERRTAESMKRVDDALKRVAQECSCLLISSPAVAANGSTGVVDVTWRVKELISR